MSALDPIALPLGGTHLIEASAGTGKTYTIATLVLRLILERELPIDRILVVTFTEAAAAELRDRIRRRLHDAIDAFADPGRADPMLARIVQARAPHADRDVARLHLALRGFDEAMISTIHGFCHRVLHDRAFETGTAFETELLTDQVPLLDEIVRDFWARELYDGDPLFVTYVQRAKLGPPRFVQLARRIAMHPDIPVLPADIEVDAKPDIGPFTSAYRDARTLWWTHRPEIVDLLTQHPGLYANRYPAATLPQWFKNMDLFMRNETPGHALQFDQLEKFTATALRQSTKKDYQARVPKHAFFDACETLVEVRRPLVENFAHRITRFKRNLIEYVRRELPRRKRRAGQQSFDDLLHDLDRALRRRKGGKDLAGVIRHRYPAALIDEFQDTDPVQYRIFRNVYAGTDAPVYFIGDPKQAIYGFRGADIFAYLEAAKSVKARHRHTMDTNWRSDPALLIAVERLFTVKRPFYLEDIEFLPVRPRPDATHQLFEHGHPSAALDLRVIRRLPTGGKGRPTLGADWAESELPRLVACEIAHTLSGDMTFSDGRRVRAGDIAVLVRKNAQAQQVQVALRKLGIPSVVYGDASVLDTRECRELARVLAAIAEPTHSGLLRAAVTTELIGVTAHQLQSMRDDDAILNRWIESFRRWHRLWVDRGFIQMWRAVLDDTDVGGRLLSLRDGERRMTNLLHLAELLHRAATTEHLGPAGLLRWMGEARDDASLQADAIKLRLESDDQAVQLITIHRSKGLEFPIVYCPYLWAPDDLRSDDEEDLIFHDPENRLQLTLDISPKPERKARGSSPRIRQARYETSAESLRLLYVALTRARHRCVLYWGLFDRAHHSALAYLLFSPPSDPAWAWDPELVAARVKTLDDEAMFSELCTRGRDAWSVRWVDMNPLPPAYSDTADQRRPLEARVPDRRIDRWFRSSSFTEMTGSHRQGRALVGQEGKDYDQQSSHHEQVVSGPKSPPILLASFPRGAKAGNFFHEVLEHLDFDAPSERRRSLLASRMRAYGYDRKTWLDPLDSALQTILEHPIVAHGPRLVDVSRGRSHRELPFVMPVGPRDDDIQLRRDALADAFASHPSGLPREYPDRLRKLGFAPLRGFLKGFIDLVFAHDDRWFVVDYKSNHLGPHVEDYGRARLESVMAMDHYILQAHLYTLALVRHLRHRIPAFDYERDFGGAAYLFLRGMTQGSHSDAGVYLDKPPQSRIEALDRVFDDPRSLR